MISDIQSYSNFVPYCQSSNVTRWSTPDAKGRRWPRRADLQVGWGGLQEIFSSRVYCVPGSVVEAVAGEAETTIASDQLAHYHGEADDEARMDQGGKQESIFKYLLTRWTVRPFLYKPPPTDAPPQDGNAMQPPQERTDVNLVIQYQFVNPVYGAMSKAVAPQLAGTMIEAFEKRASEVLAALR
ncbi:MAG: hypothetical protein M1825_000164 [Sarcosagium campestre]|nr:MAG: hypothetical protein M1825_000164 [Sarcosagium campestre]